MVIIGHDPGVQGLADVLAGEAEDDAQVPINRSGFLTSALAVLTFTGSWQDLEPSSGCLADFGAPKAV
ncbi:hypothetical protein [Streptomyces vinaceus]|uniref:hypothetical protein n=1 Tax=Streptomyces vinaceus TaxID=1960 RepID=UPI0036B6A0A9